ncbi:MAG: hypothetical protein LBV05_13890 [Comamonas sp.]|jgi:hypothetical protein|nr:hypothetical protein [uncultured Comamonas sp.]MDR3066577.1 hypothetical protein [Comamonas sp.]MEB5963488.1 hypothetical protein [Comamonas testosteroni]
MSRAIQRLSLRSALLLLIMAAQLLIPLLHGHFGTPNQSGLHVHTTPSRMADSHFHLFSKHDALGEQLDDQALAEPFEVDVQNALQPLDLLPAPLLAVMGLALLTLGLRASLMRCIAARPVPRPRPAHRLSHWQGRIIRPSPAQAPPSFS